MRSLTKTVSWLLCFTLLSFVTVPVNKALREKHFNLKDGLAIQGYDPVSYFTQGKAIKGKKSISLRAYGVLYYFSTEANKNLFKSDYSRYEPEYGGWCAYAMGNSNEKVEIDPQTFKLIDGKLYLFYNAYFNNTKTSWDKDEKRLKAKADANWEKMFR